MMSFERRLTKAEAQTGGTGLPEGVTCTLILYWEEDERPPGQPRYVCRDASGAVLDIPEREAAALWVAEHKADPAATVAIDWGEGT
jgi:hypothetical protein